VVIIWLSAKGTLPRDKKKKKQCPFYHMKGLLHAMWCDRHRDMENDRWSLYAYEDALLPGHDPVQNKGV
jgi:hypothetical protein